MCPLWADNFPSLLILNSGFLARRARSFAGLCSNAGPTRYYWRYSALYIIMQQEIDNHVAGLILQYAASMLSIIHRVSLVYVGAALSICWKFVGIVSVSAINEFS